ncbi:MAG: flagellar hook-associated protein FlgK [Phycisphaeraceae bacterium]
MSLGSSLNIGRSGLLSSQTALQTVGNNLANAATRGYNRQTVALQPTGSQPIGQNSFVGRGVQLQAITRQIDEALQTRLRGAIADESSSAVHHELLSQIESIYNEYTDSALSSRLGAFFSSWSNVANNPQDAGLRSLVVQEADGLARFVQSQRDELVNLRAQVDRASEATAGHIDGLLGDVEKLNRAISQAEGGAGSGANDLRDQRDVVLTELAGHLDISTIESDAGQVDVFVGSLPIVLDGKSRGVELHNTTRDGQDVTELRIKADGSRLDLSSGELGGMLAFRDGDLASAIDSLDQFAGQLIWQVNQIHSQGQGTALLNDVTGASKVADTSALLNSEAAGLAFAPGHGSFQVHVTDAQTGQKTTHTIHVDLDGIDGDDTTLDSLVADLDALTNVSAGVTADGRLNLAADSTAHKLSFSDDTSGALAALGVNTFFTGSTARDIAVNQTVRQSPSLIAAAQGHEPGDNRNALAIAGLREQAVSELGGNSLTGFWNRHVEQVGSRTAQARQQSDAQAIVRENLEAKMQSVSGVNIDEEAIDLMRYQRNYQANARFLGVVDELMQTLMNLV